MNSALPKNLGDQVQTKALMGIKDWIQEQTGIHFGQEKLPVLQSRLESICLKHGYKDLEILYDALLNSHDRDIIRQVVEAATTNHTHFYREVDPLLYYRDAIIPQLPKDESWRVWSAASSSGEELYTLCMLSVDKLGYEFTKSNISFLGTDVNPQVVEQAEMGVYPEIRIADLPDELKRKWFNSLALGSYSVKQELKDLCIFRKLNLKNYPWPFTRNFHVIFLRNVLYYFEEDTQEEIVNNIYQVVKPGGWLITSVTENISGLKHSWRKIQAGIYQK